MKRYAVFNCPEFYPSGGMLYFVAAFDTLEEAEQFCKDKGYGYYNIEDMLEYLGHPIEHLPTT